VLLKYRVHANSVTFKYAEIQRSNSDKVIQYLFGKIGVDISAEIIPLWIKFCYVEFNLSINELKQIEKLIVALINANKASKYVSNKALEQFLVIKWFDICYNNIKNKQVQTIFNNSSVSALLPLKSRLKFRLKGLI
jgi:hypothetical protein